MLAIQISHTGGPEVLEAVDLPIPKPGPGEILIRHQAIGLNFIDTYMRSGLYPMQLPSIIGSEGAGVVEAVGEGVTRFEVGDRVAHGAAGRGAYAEYQVLAAGRVSKLPDDIDVKTAAAAMLKGMTAEMLLRHVYPLKAGEPCLIWAASGGVGSILSQWAHAIGAMVIGCVGSEAKAELARSHGCDHVILYKSQDVAARVREITGDQGVRVSYDGVGKASFEPSIKSLGRRGMLVTYGNASGPVPPFEPLVLSRNGSLFLTRPTLFDYVVTTEELDASAEALFEVIRSGVVKIEIGHEYALKDVQQAHRDLQAGETFGSQLLIP
jgi:NADPH2:quinone reductase